MIFHLQRMGFQPLDLNVLNSSLEKPYSLISVSLQSWHTCQDALAGSPGNDYHNCRCCDCFACLVLEMLRLAMP